MPRRRRGDDVSETTVATYRYDDARRTNVPPAALAAQGRVREVPRLQFAYDPHRPPTLRFDQTGEADQIKEILAASRSRALTAEESRLLSEALQQHEPWLEWAGKREQKQFEVDPVALHLHERVSAQAILKVAAREPVQRSLFADPELDYRRAVQFYQHDVDWANRLILGDSLQVMASLARRENLAGQVQMIYIDPPYGIRFGSNFQPEVGRRDVKDTANDLTREPEMVKAYRDTWTLGVHSYLAYLRDRLVLARELLSDSGSIFVQIGDENLHRVRALLDEVFGVENFVLTVVFKKKGATTPTDPVNDYLIWYAKNHHTMILNSVYAKRNEPEGDTKVNTLIGPNGDHVRTVAISPGDAERLASEGYEWARVNYPLVSQEPSSKQNSIFSWRDRDFSCGRNRHWTYNPDEQMPRLAQAERVFDGGGESLGGIVLWSDWSYVSLSNLWDDLHGEQQPTYVVQTNRRVIERCLLMTTSPGDLVLDPTCGSGTTAFVAEQWGRRWITIDTSRVALAIARQRLLTAHFQQYQIRDGQNQESNGGGRTQSNPGRGFLYKTAPRISLRSIAQNRALDPVFAKHQPILDERLDRLNLALAEVTPELRRHLAAKLDAKQKREGKRAVTDADRRRWLLPREPWREWEVPFDADEEWPEPLREALVAYRTAWRAKMDEVDATIAAGAEQEELVDQPEVVRGVVRVSGPFTVEAVMPAEQSLDAEDESPIGGAPDDLETFDGTAVAADPTNAEAYLDRMLRLLKLDGVRFPNNRVASFTRLDPLQGGDYIQAEGEWETEAGEVVRVAVSFGPEHGPVTSYQVENAIRMAYRRGYDDLVFAGFSFDAAAQAAVQEDADDPSSRLRCHLAHIRPDVQMTGLLKETPSAQLFTVFGSPRTVLHRQQDGEYVVEMQGVDIYNPVENTILPTSADKVAAWFVDADYDGQTFCITQAFFPDKSAWDRLARALKGVVDEEAFAALSGTTSLPFPAGDHTRVAVKVIDPRGNEVMRVHRLDGAEYAERAHA